MGSPREAVKSAQQILNSTGLVYLAVDGSWGPKTQAAYQAASPATRAAVDAALKGAQISVAAIKRYQADGGDSNKELFKNEVIPAVRKYAREAGFNGDLMVAQLSLESGGGGRIPKGSNNWGGIKARAGEPAVQAMTTEVERGVGVRRKEPFRAFSSPDEFAQAYVNRLAKLPRYKAAYSARDAKDGARLLGKSGYATDLAYESKLLAALRRTSDVA